MKKALVLIVVAGALAGWVYYTLRSPDEERLREKRRLAESVLAALERELSEREEEERKFIEIEKELEARNKILVDEKEELKPQYDFATYPLKIKQLEKLLAQQIAGMEKDIRNLEREKVAVQRKLTRLELALAGNLEEWDKAILVEIEEVKGKLAATRQMIAATKGEVDKISKHLAERTAVFTTLPHSRAKEFALEIESTLKAQKALQEEIKAKTDEDQKVAKALSDMIIEAETASPDKVEELKKHITSLEKQKREIAAVIDSCIRAQDTHDIHIRRLKTLLDAEGPTQAKIHYQEMEESRRALRKTQERIEHLKNGQRRLLGKQETLEAALKGDAAAKTRALTHEYDESGRAWNDLQMVLTEANGDLGRAKEVLAKD
ncbi:MAG: hypothetical protein ACYTHM_10440 [Planctomycetota bacterium]